MRLTLIVLALGLGNVGVFVAYARLIRRQVD